MPQTKSLKTRRRNKPAVDAPAVEMHMDISEEIQRENLHGKCHKPAQSKSTRTSCKNHFLRGFGKKSCTPRTVPPFCVCIIENAHGHLTRLFESGQMPGSRKRASGWKGLDSRSVFCTRVAVDLE